jgi:hypothetical protein
MPQKPDGVIYISPNGGSIAIQFGKKFFTVNRKDWQRFLEKGCVDVTELMGNKWPSGSRHPSGGGYGYPTSGSPTESGISERESLRRLFRDI